MWRNEKAHRALWSVDTTSWRTPGTAWLTATTPASNSNKAVKRLWRATGRRTNK